MKKTYQQPTLLVMTMAESLPIAASLKIDNTARDGITGDVKGDWADIWDAPATDLDEE